MARPLSYLLDTNIWLERLLNQDRTDGVKQLPETVSTDRLSITDFSFHSIGVILIRLNRTEAFSSFVKDLFVDNPLRLLVLEPGDMERLIAVASDYRLDFDDACQYVAAERNGVRLVSLDGDFNSSELGRITPAEATDQQDNQA